MEKEILIDGCVTLQEGQTEDMFRDSFIEWLESKNLSFGGGINEVREEKVAGGLFVLTDYDEYLLEKYRLLVKQLTTTEKFLKSRKLI